MAAKVGRPREPYRSKWQMWKRNQRAGTRASHCANCGKRLVGRDGVQDHKDGNQANQSRGNLRSLCRSCHLKKSIASGEVHS